MENKLQEWTAPRLMRLNQIDGTEKHVVGPTEVNFGTGWLTVSGGCATSTSASGGGGSGPIACGPS